MTIISGTLTDGAGQIINDCTIELYAKKTTNNVLTQTQAFTVANDGKYSINVLPCEYDVSLIINGFPKKRLGTINVYSNSANGTLNDFLINPTQTDVTPEFIKQVMDARDDAKKSANNAQKWASTIDTSTLVKKSGDTMTGQLTLSQYGVKLPFDNGNTIALKISSDNYSHIFYDSETQQRTSILVYNPTKNEWNFPYVNDVTINNKSVLKTGDYGVGSLTGTTMTNPDERLLSGWYATKTSDFADLSGNDSATLAVYGSSHKNFYVEQLFTVASKTPRIFSRCATPEGKQPWYESITTANSTVDSNGFYKKSSPIVRLFGSENINLADGFTQSGCGLVNSLATGVTAKRIDVGHYEVQGSLGFAREGWYITLPEDANGNKKFFAEYSVDDNNVITVKTYTRKFSTKLCEIVAGDPIDITDGRWIDLRLEMPKIIEQEEIIPSVLNPVITTEE